MKIRQMEGKSAAKLSVWGLLGFAVLLGLTACNTAPAPPPDTRAADEAAVRKTDADWVNAAKSRKAEDWVAFYSDDAVLLPPNDKTVSGRENIRKMIGEMLAAPNVVITWAPTKVEVAKSADIAYLYGTYQMSWDDASGKSVNDTGKMVEIWKKQADGSWKCIVDSWNTDLPPAPAAPASK